MTLILRYIGVVTSVIIFPFGIIVLIVYYCKHKYTGNKYREGKRERGREGGRKGGMEGDEGERE